MADQPISIIRILEKRVSMSESGVSIAEKQVDSVRVSADDRETTRIASAYLNAWLTANPGKTATYSYVRWYPHHDEW